MSNVCNFGGFYLRVRCLYRARKGDFRVTGLKVIVSANEETCLLNESSNLSVSMCVFLFHREWHTCSSIKLAAEAAAGVSQDRSTIPGNHGDPSSIWQRLILLEMKRRTQSARVAKGQSNSSQLGKRWNPSPCSNASSLSVCSGSKLLLCDTGTDKFSHLWGELWRLRDQPPRADEPGVLTSLTSKVNTGLLEREKANSCSISPSVKRNRRTCEFLYCWGVIFLNNIIVAWPEIYITNLSFGNPETRHRLISIHSNIERLQWLIAILWAFIATADWHYFSISTPSPHTHHTSTHACTKGDK